jgi:transposase InsO family protein
MMITMDDTEIKTLAQIQKILETSTALTFKGLRREAIYSWITSVLKRFDYFHLGKKGKGLVKAYLERMSGRSRAQITRLVLRNLQAGAIKTLYRGGKRYAVKYTVRDHDLLVETDNAHGRLSGPATKRIFQRQYVVYGDKRFVRLSTISSAHIYNLRSSRAYQQRAQTVAKTHSVCVSIGIRRKPEPQGRPGYIRVDTVHQGDLKGKKGVYHINMVDAVTQWEIVLCVEAISEAHLEPVLAIALVMFPFLVVNFHSDNGSEFINGVIAKLLNKLLIEQTKSRSGRTNDNALVEGKNGSVIRKHMGHWHIEQKHAPLINRFYQEHFNSYLNFHRPCGFATVTVDEKGRRTKKYKTYQTPYERLKMIVEAEKDQTYLREGITLKALDAIAAKQTDNEAAALMQAARDRMFKKFGVANA